MKIMGTFIYDDKANTLVFARDDGKALEGILLEIPKSETVTSGLDVEDAVIWFDEYGQVVIVAAIPPFITCVKYWLHQAWRIPRNKVTHLITRLKLKIMKSILGEIRKD